MIALVNPVILSLQICNVIREPAIRENSSAATAGNVNWMLNL